MRSINRCYICETKDLDDLSAEAARIAAHTANTWQANRSEAEKRSDTALGKLAEAAVERFFREGRHTRLIPYDAFRTDRFEYHAPFDELICEKHVDPGLLKEIQSRICEEANRDRLGHLTPSLRQHIQSSHMYLMEIKSTRITDNRKQAAQFTDYDDDAAVSRLVDVICRDDFLTYPHFLRAGDLDWEAYCRFVAEKDYRLRELTGSALSEAVRRLEMRFMANVYVRVYVDSACGKALLLGYASKDAMMQSPQLKKMIRPGKSEAALYLSAPLTVRRDLAELL